MFLNNSVGSDFEIRSSDNLLVSAAANRNINVDTTGTGNINLSSAASNITIDAFGVNRVEGGSVVLSSASTVASTSNSDTDITSTTGDINLNAGNGVINMNTPLVYASTALQVDGATTLNGATSINHNLIVNQNSYAQPMATTTRLGYTNTKTQTTDPMSNTLASRMDFTIPSAGVWLIIGQMYWATNTGNTIEVKECVISTASGSAGAAAYGLIYYDEINDNAGSSGKRQHLNINGVYTATAATTLYVNARSQVDAGTNTEFNIAVSWTRIG